MNRDLLLTHFNRISDAPDAIPRLRRFILDLAVRGKLVEQGPEGKPEVVVGRSLAIRRPASDEHEGLGGNQVWPYELPSSWQWQKLGDISEQVTDGEHATPPRIQEQQVPLVTAKNIRDGFMDYGNTDWVSFATAEKAWKRCRPSVGDILLVCVGATIGRLCALREARDMVLVRSVALIRPSAAINVDYLGLALRSPVSYAQMWAKIKVSAQPCLYINRINSLPVAFPPIEEQRRIVAKVDELMTLCNQLAAAQTERECRRDRLAAATLHQINGGSSRGDFGAHARFYLDHLAQLIVRPEQIPFLRRMVLSLGVCGALTPQNPHDEPVAEQLLLNDRVREATAKQDHRAEAERQVLLAAEDRWNVPSSWEWCALADLVLFIDYRGKTPNKIDNGVRLVTAKNVKKGFINAFPEEFLSEREYHAWMTRGFPKEGDILFTTEAPMGNAAVVRLPERFALAQRVICFRPYGAANPDFLALQLLAQPFHAILDKTATGLTAKGIKAAKLRRLPVAVPPLAEQLRIVVKVNEVMRLCDHLEAQLTKTQDEKCSLLEAVLYRSLNDESEASVMATQLATRSVDTAVSAI